jgi:hypothetical protein
MLAFAVSANMETVTAESEAALRSVKLVTDCLCL